MPSTMKIEFTGEFKADIEKRGQATAVHLMGEAFDVLKAKMVELGLLNVSGDIRTVPERKAKEVSAPEPTSALIPPAPTLHPSELPLMQTPEDISGPYEDVTAGFRDPSSDKRRTKAA